MLGCFEGLDFEHPSKDPDNSLLKDFGSRILALYLKKSKLNVNFINYNIIK